MAVFWTYAVLGVVGLLIAIVAYSYAVSTRRRVVCASCGEAVQMEHDRIRHCPSCGAEL